MKLIVYSEKYQNRQKGWLYTQIKFIATLYELRFPELEIPNPYFSYLLTTSTFRLQVGEAKLFPERGAERFPISHMGMLNPAYPEELPDHMTYYEKGNTFEFYSANHNHLGEYFVLNRVVLDDYPDVYEDLIIPIAYLPPPDFFNQGMPKEILDFSLICGDSMSIEISTPLTFEVVHVNLGKVEAFAEFHPKNNSISIDGERTKSGVFEGVYSISVYFEAVGDPTNSTFQDFTLNLLCIKDPDFKGFEAPRTRPYILNISDEGIVYTYFERRM